MSQSGEGQRVGRAEGGAVRRKVLGNGQVLGGMADLSSRDVPEGRRGPRLAWTRQVISVKDDTTENMEGRSGGRCRPQVSKSSSDWTTGGQWWCAGPRGTELRQEGTMASSQSPGFLLMNNGFEL